MNDIANTWELTLTTSTLRPDVREFLERFSDTSRNSDSDVQRGFWAEIFLSLDPTRVAAVEREAMLAALPQRRKLFESIGATASELIEAEETPLDDLHTIVRTSWRWRLVSPEQSNEDLVLHSTFLLRRQENDWTIVVYLNHQNVGALIAERAAARSE